jgi:uncharacterized protein
MKCKCIGIIALILTIIGALNWGLWGFFQFDVVAWLCGGNTTLLSRTIYAIIGLAGLVSIKALCCCKKSCSCCKGGDSSCSCSCHNKDACSTDSKGKGGCCR